MGLATVAEIWLLKFLYGSRADIQRRGTILAWIVILSVYGADKIAIDLSLSALISLFMKYIGVLNNPNLHAIICTLLIINWQWVKQIYFAVLYEIYNFMMFLIGQPFWSLAIIQLHALSLLQKTVQIRDQFFLYMDPDNTTFENLNLTNISEPEHPCLLGVSFRH